MAYDDTLSDRGGFSVVYLREQLKEQMAKWGDPWKYGIKANQTTIDAFIKYNVEQGMIRKAPSLRRHLRRRHAGHLTVRMKAEIRKANN